MCFKISFQVIEIAFVLCVTFVSISPWCFDVSYDQMDDPHQAIEWLMQVISVTPTDPHVLAKLGKLHNNEGEKSQALHYYSEVWQEEHCFFFLQTYYWSQVNGEETVSQDLSVILYL